MSSPALAAMPSDAIPLAELSPGRRGRLASPRQGRPIPRRLQDLGFVPGTLVQMVRRAPFGDPVEVELRGYRLCLRLAQLAVLEVEPEDATT